MKFTPLKTVLPSQFRFDNVRKAFGAFLFGRGQLHIFKKLFPTALAELNNYDIGTASGRLLFSNHSHLIKRLVVERISRGINAMGESTAGTHQE